MAATILLAAAMLVVFRQQLRKRVEAYGTAPVAAGPMLRAAPAVDGVRITWPAGARAAALSVKDGGQWRQIALDGPALAAHQYLYRASSAEVQVRMDGQTVRVLGLTPRPVTAAVEMAQAAPPADVHTADRAVPAAAEVADRKVPAPFPKALRTIQGSIHVDVQVAVAADGTVESAEVVAPAHSPYFNRLSVAAAQGSRFRRSAGASAVVLRYEYSRDGVAVSQAGQ